MRSRPYQISTRAPLSADAPAGPESRSQSDPARTEIDPDRECEVTIEMDVDGPRRVVSVVGPLGYSGGALLSAVLEYVRERGCGPVALDLRGVSHADRHGLAPVIESGAVLAGTSPAVDQVLASATRPTDAEGRNRSAGSGRLPSSGKPVPDIGPGNPTVDSRSISSRSTTSDPTS